MIKIVSILAFLLFTSCSVFAQDDEAEDEYLDDSTEMTTTVVVEDDVERFDQVNPATLKLTPRQVDTALLREIRSDKAFSYVVKQPKKKKVEKPSDSSWLSDLSKQKWLKTLLWILVILSFIAILVAFLTRSNITLFRKEPKKMESADEPEESSGNIFDINYDADIPKAIEKGNYHLAVRLLYLQLLKDLSERNLIDYRHERTNGDYLFQLFNTPYYKHFFSLTRNYEYVWYGKFPVSPGAFQTMRTDFREFYRRLPV